MDLRLAAQQLLHPLQAHLARLEAVEREAQQGGGEHQPLHKQNQSHQVADREPAALQLATAQGQQQQQAHGTDALQQREQRAAGAGQLQGVVAVTAVALGEGLPLGGLLAVDLDGADAGEVLLDQIAQLGQGLLLAPLLFHHAAAEQPHDHQHQRVEPHRRQAQPGVDRQHGRQGEGVGQGRVGQAEHRKAQQAPHVLHVAGGAADHLAAAGGLHPARLLAEHVVEDLLLKVRLHLAAHAEHQHPRPQPHGPHHGGEADDQQRLAQHIGHAEAVLQVVDHTAHQQRDRHAQQVDHHQRRHAQQHRAAIGAQVAPDQAEADRRHGAQQVLPT